MPPAAPPRLQPNIATTAQFLFALLKANAADPDIQRDILAQAPDPTRAAAILKKPDQFIYSYQDLTRYFGDLRRVVVGLNQKGLLTGIPKTPNQIISEAWQDAILLKAASRAAELPTYDLKLINVDQAGRADLEREREEADGLLREGLWDQEIFDKWIEAYDEAEKELENLKNTRRLPIDPVSEERLKKIKNNKELQDCEELLVSRKVDEILGRRILAKLEDIGNMKERKKEAELLKKPSQYREYIEAKNEGQEIENRKNKQKIGVAGAAPPALQALNYDIPSAASKETATVGHASFVDPYGVVDKKKFTKAARKGAAVAKARANVEKDAQDGIHASVKHYLAHHSTNSTLNDKVAEAIAEEFARDYADYHEWAIKAETGVKYAGQGVLKDYIEKNTYNHAFRTRLAHAIIKTVLKEDPLLDINDPISRHTAQSRAQAWIDSCVKGMKNAAPLAARKGKFELGGRGQLVYEEKIAAVDKDGHLVRGTTRTAFAPDPVAAAQAFSRAYRLKKDISGASRALDQLLMGEESFEGKIDRLSRQRRLQRQVAFVEGVMVAKRTLEENPVFGVAEVGANLAYGYLPRSIQESSITERSLMIAGATAPFIGPFAPALALAHQAHWAQDRFQKEYGFPLLSTNEWMQAFAEGKIKEFAAQFMPLAPVIAKYDEKGNLGIGGIHLIPAAWDLFRKGVGQNALNWYNKQYLGLSDAFTEPVAKKMAAKNPVMQAIKRIGLRWKDDSKKTDPLSLLIFGPLWAAAKGIMLAGLESAGYSTALRRFFVQGIDSGRLSEAWNYGAGWADKHTINDLIKDAIDDLPEGLDTKAQAAAEAKINTHFNRLHFFGRAAKWTSTAWQGTKIGIGTLLRGGIVTGVSFLMGAPLPLAIGIGASYSIPWGINKFLSTPLFGGSWVPGTDGSKLTAGVYQEGILKGGLGKLAKLWNAPVDELLNLRKVSLGGRLGIWGVRNIPLNGIFLGFFLWKLGIPAGWAFGVPIAADLGIKAVRGLAKTKLFFNTFGAPTSFWAKLTGGLGTFIQVGSLAYAIRNGLFGPDGLFAVFSKFNVQNLLRFLQLPAAYISFLTLFAAFSVGIPAWIAAGIATLGVIGIDAILKAAGKGGLWQAFFQPVIVDPFLNFLKNKGIGMATGVLSSIIGLFGLISAALKGDIQGIAISLIMMTAGIGFILYSGSNFPASYSTPAVEGAGTVQPVPPPEIPSNDYIENAEKEFQGINGNTIIYNYSFDLNLGSNTEITLTEQDVFEGIPANAIDDVTMDGVDPTLTDGKRVITVTETTSASHVSRTLRITLNDSLDSYLQEDEQLCNTLTITTSPSADQDIVQYVCIDAQGEPVTPPSGETHLPVDPNEGSLTQCYTASHHGIDIGTNIDSDPNPPVYAVWAGTVSRVARNPGGYGNLIIIQHDNNRLSYYAHLQSFAVSAGDTVDAGDIIGNVGTTGQSTGEHLHFEVRYRSEDITIPTNPCDEEDLRRLNLCTVYGGIDCT